MLRKSLKISGSTKKEIFELKPFQIDKKYDKTTSGKISAVFQTF